MQNAVRQAYSTKKEVNCLFEKELVVFYLYTANVIEFDSKFLPIKQRDRMGWSAVLFRPELHGDCTLIYRRKILSAFFCSVALQKIEISRNQLINSKRA